MAIDIYYHERCSKCGEIRGALKKHDVEYKGHFFPPRNADLKVSPKTPHPETGADFAPVLVHAKTAPDGVIGYKEILEWIKENYE